MVVWIKLLLKFFFVFILECCGKLQSIWVIVYVFRYVMKWFEEILYFEVVDIFKIRIEKFSLVVEVFVLDFEDQFYLLILVVIEVFKVYFGYE